MGISEREALQRAGLSFASSVGSWTLLTLGVNHNGLMNTSPLANQGHLS